MLIGLTVFHALLTNGDPPPRTVCGIAVGSIEVILATIRTLESGRGYTAEAHGATASGADQFVDGTWNGCGGLNRCRFNWTAPSIHLVGVGPVPARRLRSSPDVSIEGVGDESRITRSGVTSNPFISQSNWQG